MRVLVAVLVLGCGSKPAPTVKLEERGLVLAYREGWTRTTEGPRTVLAAPDGSARIEVVVEPLPQTTAIDMATAFDRRMRFGEAYRDDFTDTRELNGKTWLRTRFQAHSAPAIEYVTSDHGHTFTITLFAPEGALDELDAVVGQSLVVSGRTGIPLLEHRIHRTTPPVLDAAGRSAVAIVLADVVDGRPRATAVASGTVVGSDGSVLTLANVLEHHTTFAIGRGTSLVCAGSVDEARVMGEFALVKCTRDFENRPAKPPDTWLPLANRTDPVKAGVRVWTLGYSEHGGGMFPGAGEVERVDADAIKTDASITRGTSGAPVVDDAGRLVGIAAFQRPRVSANGTQISTVQIGTVLPISSAADLRTLAEVGWTPKAGDSQLADPKVPDTHVGIQISTVVLNAKTDAPIAGALVVVLKQGITTKLFDANKLDDQVLSWGRSNARGEVVLKQPVPIGTYSVVVVAPGYQPLLGDDTLRLDAKTPPAYDPWGGIKLAAR